jgi:hypothetical protein
MSGTAIVLLMKIVQIAMGMVIIGKFAINAGGMG